jgi:hypothetical protein
MDRLNGFKFI